MNFKPQIESYLEAKCQELAKGDNSGRGIHGHGYRYDTYSKALTNVKAYPGSLSSGPQCQEIKGIGKVIAEEIQALIDREL